MQKAIFLDRDGVINIDKSYVSDKENFEFCAGVFEALEHFQSKGYLLIIVTNQSGIGRGYYTQEDFESLTQWMREELLKKKVRIDAVYFCPHAPEAQCACRKPKSGMFHEAIEAFDIDVKASWMIGDKPTDIQAAQGAGITNTILIGPSICDGAKTSVNFILDTIDLI
ncbi:MAG: D-glycero-beta-D-manno-heptose 1,7-bisphosphate 7-phosphatase [Sulfurospirillaceae bacterium]|nr:D-glycero-beta-D-manno-heptose 1,7-bisphosphate 7-phosphatase [Sulfurospirillaceae bacterium]